MIRITGGGETMDEDDMIWTIPCTTEDKLKVMDILCKLDKKPSYVLDVFLKAYGNQK